MIKTVKAFVIAATVTLPTATVVSAQDIFSMGNSMLTGALVNSLRQAGVSTDCVQHLTLNETVQIRSVLQDPDTPTNEMRSQAERILERACERSN